MRIVTRSAIEVQSGSRVVMKLPHCVIALPSIFEPFEPSVLQVTNEIANLSNHNASAIRSARIVP
jgi:hypothetical protein